MPSLKSWIAQSSAVSAFATTMAFIVYTKHCSFPGEEPLNSLDPKRYKQDHLFQSASYVRFNPRKNTELTDDCVRRVPLWKVRRELWDPEWRKPGDPTLVEAFCGGVWGTFGYGIQRKYLERKYRDNLKTKHQLWDKRELLDNHYDIGTEITDHFVVVSKDDESIVVRAGDSPMNSPTLPREVDGLLEIRAKVDIDRGFAEFHLKSVFFSGTAQAEEGQMLPRPLSELYGLPEFLHKQYAKLLVESGVGAVTSRNEIQKLKDRQQRKLNVASTSAHDRDQN